MPDLHRVAADVVVTHEDAVLLVKRGVEPFKGQWCLPGGHVEAGEQVGAAAVREVREETGVTVALDELVGVFDAPGRDPRGPVIAIAYTATPVDDAVPTGATDADAARWWPLDDVPETLGFDHADILAAAVTGHDA